MSWKCPVCGGRCAEENLDNGKHGVICPLCGSEVGDETMKAEKSHDGVRYSDPCMAMVGFSRKTYPGGLSLFGSSVKNSNVISLTIYEADMDRHLSQDWYHAKRKPIVEVIFSPLQFSELLTTMNIGFGVPGTLRYHGDQDFELPEFPSKADQFKGEVEDRLKAVIKELNEAGEVIEGLIDDPKPIGKQVRKQLKNLVSSFRGAVENSFPFILQQFGKQMERTVTEAKSEVDAFIEDTIIKTGIEELKKRTPQMMEEKNDGYLE
jgi:hypothetical protein